jgi:purine-binding chemotaxis protein CheW
MGVVEAVSLNWLLCRAGRRLCALPLEHVVETMRPLPIDGIAGSPGLVLGLSIVRGSPIPVVDIGTLFSEPGTGPRRIVTVRTGGRVVALAVQEVVGVRSIEPDMLEDLPPLLRDAAGEVVSAIGRLDSELLLFLSATRLLPQDMLEDVRVNGTGQGTT